MDIKAIYSTPSNYFKSVQNEKPKLNNYNIDFLNYDEKVIYMHPNASPT